MAKHFIYFISAFFSVYFPLSFGKFETLKKRAEKWSHTQFGMHTDTVLAKFFIPIYRCIISFLSFILSFLLSKWFLLTFCARYTAQAKQRPATAHTHAHFQAPFPQNTTILPFAVSLPRKRETPAHSSNRTEPGRAGRQLHAMRKCPQRQPARES